jgi:hypothetical protein
VSLSDALRDKLQLPGVKPGPIEVESEDGLAQVDLVAGDGIGVRVNRVRISVPDAAPLADQADQICGRVRALGERIVPLEVEPRLSGGVLRSAPADMRNREYYEVGLDGSGATVERFRANADVGRERQSFSLTHDQLEELVSDLSEGLRVPDTKDS